MAAHYWSIVRRQLGSSVRLLVDLQIGRKLQSGWVSNCISTGHLLFVNSRMKCAPREIVIGQVNFLFSLASWRMAWWESNNYQSFCLPSEESEPEDLEDREEESSAQLDYEDPDSSAIKYVSGDVTHPQAGAEDAVIVHCVGRRSGTGPGWVPCSLWCQELGRRRQKSDPGMTDGPARSCGQKKANFRIQRYRFDSWCSHLPGCI